MFISTLWAVLIDMPQTVVEVLRTLQFARYVTALYWSMSTMTTVGYGDVIPGNSREKMASMVGMMVGITAFAYFMGSMSALLSAWNTNTSRMAAKRQVVDDFLRFRRLPHDLSTRVRNFYSYVTEREVQKDEADIIKGLSSSLQQEVHARSIDGNVHLRGSCLCSV